MMKKIASILLLALILNGCDDGNLEVDTIGFNNTDLQSCTTNGVIYNLNERESILLQLPENTLTDASSANNVPTQYIINNSTYKVIYRAYDGTVTSSNICDAIPPAFPNVIDQWTATGGIIEVLTRAIKSTNTTDNSTRITGYNHNITFKNITFLKPEGPQVYETFPFGDYQTSITSLPLTFKEAADQCSTSKQLYNYNSSASITIDDIDPELLKNEATPAGSPRTGLINANGTANKLQYKFFTNGVLTSNYFCQTTPPLLPTVSQTWNGQNGVAATSGIIEVVTETNGPGVFKHTIRLKKVTLVNGSDNFLLGDDFLFGVINTTL